MRLCAASLSLLSVLISRPDTALGKTIRVPGSYRDVQAALDAASPGDVVLVAPGEYRVDRPLVLSGKPVTLRSEAGASRTTIRLASPSESIVVDFEGADSLEGFSVADGASESGRGLVRACAASPVISGCRVGLFYSLATSRPKLIDVDALAISAEGGGADVEHSTCGEVYATRGGITLKRCRVGAARAYEDAGLAFTSCLIESVSLEERAQASIASSTVLGPLTAFNSSSYDVTGSIVWTVSQASITLSGQSTAAVRRSILRGDRVFSGTGNSNRDPLFAGAGDYRLRRGSPAIDLGEGDAGPLDLDGNQRVCGPSIDMGAYESCAASGGFVRGDVTGDGRHDISDPLSLLTRLFAGETRSAACDKAADMDDDGRLDIADPIALLVYLFAGGRPPQEPFPGCGSDSTADSLGCEGQTSCS
jgi:hypothetical protein